MAKHVDGSVRFDTRIDRETAAKDLDKLKSFAKKSFKAIGLSASAAFIGATKAGIDFESAFAGVKKTVNASEAELSKLRQGIRDMAKEIPVAADNIAAIAEGAGQLGIQTKNILGFSRTMADLGVATNLTGEEAASTLAKFANIAKMPQEMFSNLGSTIVALGNNLATTEADIAAMAQRLAGAGSQIGMSEAEILSFAGALSSVGIEAEAGGSAFSRLMSDMQLAVETGNSDLKNFASVAGMSAAQFKQAFKEDAAGALLEFISGLSNTERNGKSTTEVLSDMGITEIRLSDALKRASNASDLFKDAVELGNKAWKENNALTKEASQRYETTESKIKILGNKVTDLGITAYDAFSGAFGKAIDTASRKIDELTNAFESGSLSGSIESLGDTFSSLIEITSGIVSAVLPPLVSGLGYVTDNFGIIAGVVGAVTGAILAYKGAVTATNAVQSLFNTINVASAAGVNGWNIALGLATGNLTAKTVAEAAATTGTTAHAAAQTALNTALAANSIGVVVGALALLAGGIIVVTALLGNSSDKFSKMGDEVSASTEEFKKADEAQKQVTSHSDAWRTQKKAIEDCVPGTEEYKKAQEKLSESEQWFIDNYGMFISAEEKKNGIRDETIKKIERAVALERERKALEAEDDVNKMSDKAPKIINKVNADSRIAKNAQNMLPELYAQKTAIGEANLEWEKFLNTSYTIEEKLEKEKEILEKVNKELGTNYTSVGQLSEAEVSLEGEISKTEGSLEGAEKRLKKNTESLQEYADGCKSIIENKLGDTLDGFADKYNAVSDALHEVKEKGEVSKETMAALKEVFPDLAKKVQDAINNGEDPTSLLQGEFDGLNEKLDNAKTKADELGVHLNGLPKKLSTDIELNVTERRYLKQYKRGTPGAKEGPAVVNDGNGPELIEGKDGSLRMIQSKGAVLTHLNEGDRVYTAEQTRSYFRKFPHYKNGVGNDGFRLKSSNSLFDIPYSLGIAAKKIGEDFADDLGKAFSKGLSENAEKMTEEFDKSVEVLDLQLEFGHISEEEYFETLAKLRDEYLTEGTKEWYETTQEIYEHGKKAFLGALEYEHDLGLISEREYYKKLEEYRDKYLAKGSDEWREYTQNIFEYYKEQAENVFSDVLDKQENMLDKFEDHTRLTRSVTIENFYEDGSAIKYSELNTSTRELDEIKRFVNSLDAVKEKLVNNGYDNEFIKAHIDKIKALSFDDGLDYTDALLDANNDVLVKHLDIKQEEFFTLKKLSEDVYADEFDEVAKTAVNAWTDALTAAGFNVPKDFFKLGVESVNEFCDGFEKYIDSLFVPIREKFKSLIPSYEYSGQSPTASGNTFSSVYNFFSSTDTTTQQIQAAKRASERDKLAGGYLK